jgi:glycosyltransferase involved in cell wall biosynthesis
MRLDVAYINNNLQLGGAETVLQQLHGGLLARGQRSAIYVDENDAHTTASNVHTFVPRIVDRLYHTRLHDVLQSTIPRRKLTDRAFRRLAFSPHQIVHIHNFHGTYASIESLATLARAKPVVWTFHRFWGITGGCDHPGGCEKFLDHCGDCPLVDEWPICGTDKTAEQLALKKKFLADAPLCIVAPSRHLAEKVRASPVGRRWKTVQIPNGVDVEKFECARKNDASFRRALGLKPEATVILVVNRNFQEPLKGFGTILGALLNIDPRNLQIVLAGGSADWAAARLAEKFDCVSAGYIYSRERLAEFYEAADIFLYASPRENFPCVILEAMAAQCCVVSTPTDGVLEQIENGRSGLLAESFAGESLGAALRTALASSETRRNLGAAARARVKEFFSEQRMIDAHMELYTELLGQPAR